MSDHNFFVTQAWDAKLSGHQLDKRGLFQGSTSQHPREKPKSWSKASQPGLRSRSERNVFLGIPERGHHSTSTKNDTCYHFLLNRSDWLLHTGIIFSYPSLGQNSLGSSNLKQDMFISSCCCKKLHNLHGLLKHQFVLLRFWRSEVSKRVLHS